MTHVSGEWAVGMCHDAHGLDQDDAMELVDCIPRARDSKGDVVRACMEK